MTFPLKPKCRNSQTHIKRHQWFNPLRQNKILLQIFFPTLYTNIKFSYHLYLLPSQNTSFCVTIRHYFPRPVMYAISRYIDPDNHSKFGRPKLSDTWFYELPQKQIDFKSAGWPSKYCKSLLWMTDFWHKHLGEKSHKKFNREKPEDWNTSLHLSPLVAFFI